MKIKFGWMLAASVALQLAVAPGVRALTTAQRKQITHLVIGAPLPEMPAQAAAVVAKADKGDRAEVAALVVRAVVGKHKAAAPVVVAAIAKAAPEVAAAAAAAAAEMDRGQAVAIADAAGMAAPAASAEIAALVARAAPGQAAAVKSAAFRGFASVSASAFTFSTKEGPIEDATESLSEDWRENAATALGISNGQLRALARRLPINLEFDDDGAIVSITIPLTLNSDGTIPQDTLDRIFPDGNSNLDLAQLRALSRPKAARPAVEIRYGAPRG
jgi:hypothetical protein